MRDVTTDEKGTQFVVSRLGFKQAILIHDPLDYTPWKHASITKTKRVQTVEMALQYKKEYSAKQIFSHLWNSMAHKKKKKKKTLTKNV